MNKESTLSFVGNASLPNGAGDNQHLAKLPFTRDVRETNRAFQAFLCWLDIGNNVPLREIARRTGTSLTSVTRWSSTFKWRERASAYQSQVLRSRIEIETKTQKDQAQLWADRSSSWKETEFEMAEELMATARMHLKALRAKEPGEASLTEIARAVEIASKLARLATGLATDKQEHTGSDGGPIRIELEAALNKIYGNRAPRQIVEVESTPAETTPGSSPAGLPGTASPLSS